MKPELPEGVEWRELTDSNRRWLGAPTKPDQSEPVGIRISVRIRRNSDGVVRTYVDEWIPFRLEDHSIDDVVGSVIFQWSSDGNSGCDCNRATYFARAAGELHELDEFGCSDGKYSVVYPAWLADEHESY